MKNELILNTKTSVIEGSKIIYINAVIDEFVSTKRSINTKRGYAKDIVDLFGELDISTLNDLGTVPFFQLVKEIHDHLENKTEYDEQIARP